MRKPLPTIHESADELKHRIKQERHPPRHQRLEEVYRMASGKAPSRREMPTLLVVARNAGGPCLAQSGRGGLDPPLLVYIPAGKRKPLTPALLAQLQQAL